MKIPMAILAAAFCLASPARADDVYDKCMQDSDGTNTAWAECGAGLVARSDKALNDAWKALHGSIDDADTAKAMLEEQRAWNEFKEKSCKFYASGYFGREGQVLSYPACRAGVIDARTAALQAYLRDTQPQ